MYVYKHCKKRLSLEASSLGQLDYVVQSGIWIQDFERGPEAEISHRCQLYIIVRYDVALDFTLLAFV